MAHLSLRSYWLNCWATKHRSKPFTSHRHSCLVGQHVKSQRSDLPDRWTPRGYRLPNLYILLVIPALNAGTHNETSIITLKMRFSFRLDLSWHSPNKKARSGIPSRAFHYQSISLLAALYHPSNKISRPYTAKSSGGSAGTTFVRIYSRRSSSVLGNPSIYSCNFARASSESGSLRFT